MFVTKSYMFRLYKQTIRVRVSALQTSHHQAVVHDCYLYFFFLLALQPIVGLYFAALWLSYSLLAYKVS